MFFAVSLSGAGSLPAAELTAGPGATAAIERAIRSVYPALVRIEVIRLQPAGGRMHKRESYGSGAVIGWEGYVITNHHVVGNGFRFLCRMYDGEVVEAELVGTDALSDVAVLRLNLEQRKNPLPLATASFGDSDRLRVGDPVFAMGSPGALSQSVTQGIVSNTRLIMPPRSGGGLSLDGEPVGTLVRWIAHDAQIFGGNSGGPLVNADGEIIGINEIGIAGLGGAIPANLARQVADQLIRRGTVHRAWIGIGFQPRLQEGAPDQGALVGGVVAGSPACAAGVKAGDHVLSIAGQGVDAVTDEHLTDINRLVFDLPVDREVPVVVLRAGTEQTLMMTPWERGRARGEDQEVRAWGMIGRDLSSLSAMELKRPTTDGVQVISLRPGGPGSEARPSLENGDLLVKMNGRPVRGVEDVLAFSEEWLADAEDRVPVLVEIERGRQRILSVVRIGDEPEKQPPALSRTAWLPVVTQVVQHDLAEALELGSQPGVRITQLFPGRTAEKAGLQVGDILLQIDGERIEARRPEDGEVLHHMIRAYRVGSEVEVTLLRDGERMSLTVELDQPLDPATRLQRYADTELEFTVREISEEDRLFQQIDPELSGVLVERVENAGWAAIGGLVSNDILLSVDGHPTPDVDAVEQLMAEAALRATPRLVFFIQRGIHSRFLEISVPWTRTGEVEQENERT